MPPDKRFELGLRTRAPKSSRKVSAVLARVDSEVPAMRSKGARKTFCVSVCASSCVIGAFGHFLAQTISPAAPSSLAARVEISFPAWIIQKVMFLRDKDWRSVKTNHISPITITLGETSREKRVSAQAKPISEVVKDFEQSLENLRPSTRAGLRGGRQSGDQSR